MNGQHFGSPDAPPSATSLTRQRSLSIVRFLQEFTRLKTVVRRDIREYEEHLWFSDVSFEAGSYAKGRVASDDQPADLWLQVKKQPEPKLPLPTEPLRSWVSLESLGDSSQQPQLRTEIVQAREPIEGESEPPPSELIRLIDHPEISRQWDTYLTQRWQPWAALHQRWQRVHAVYSKLFAIHQMLVKLGEELELVVGVGLLAWKTPRQHTVRRHLLTARAALRFDASSGVFSVLAPADGAKIQLELDMLEADEAPSIDEKRQIDELLARSENDLWDRSAIDAILRALAHSIEDSGEFVPAFKAEVGQKDHPEVVFAPALVLRKRSVRGYLALLTSVQQQLESGAPIPGSMAIMTGETSPARTRSGSDDPGSIEDQIHFPLPANDDQLEIVRKLRGKSGVHVQGPPGTGKSHTIANLMCHLLASGKRVLVTAQTPRALKVLHDKIPKDIQPLCVSLLGNDKASFDHLERCVREIVSRYESFKEAAYRERIRDSESVLADLRRREAEVKGQLRVLRERETLKHSIADGRYAGTAAAIAHRVATEAASLGWLTDAIESTQPAPLTNAEACELLELLRTLHSASTEDKSLSAPASKDVRALISALVPLVRAEAAAGEAVSSDGVNFDKSAAAIAASMPSDKLATLRESLAAFGTAFSQAVSRRQPWVQQAIQDVLGANDTPWRSLREALPKTSDELLVAVKRRECVRLTLPSGIDQLRVAADAEDLKAHLDSGGSVGLISSLKPVVKRTKYLREEVTVDGRPANTSATLGILIDCLRTERMCDDLWRYWSEHSTRPNAPLLKQASVLAENAESLDAVLRLIGLQRQCEHDLAACPALGHPVWNDPESVRSLAAAVRHAQAVRNRADAASAIDKLLTPLRTACSQAGTHPLATDLLTALVKRDLERASSFVEPCERLETIRASKKRCGTLLETLGSKSPELAAALNADPEGPTWDERLQNFDAAWTHARAASWLQSTFGEATEHSCEAELQRIADRQGATTSTLAADLAWLQCLGRMSTEHRQHFVAWGQAMKSLGKGTGKYADKHRRDAQRNLAKCRDAIPAWIMPLHQVYESVDPAPAAFDAIIVDEASQCGLDARILTFMAKQLIVVGDDRQISPEAVGLDREEAFRLIREFLGDVPHSESFQPERSLFDFADLWFGERIVLQEHFRCVPEIIRFSSDLCYQTKPLIPLRQYPPDRLRPIVARRVNGVREGTGSSTYNKPEAEAIVSAIKRCCSDPRYNGKSFGVISLQGDGQAKLIEKLLIDALSPKEIEARRLVCGDAYSFQGDERHVMFLSMVAAPNETIGALTKDSDVRRFNVAVSRAQDQMWLFHSVDQADLNPQCCRRRLLDYCREPKRQVFRDLPVDSWRQQALARVRPMGQQPPPFESWFELDVFLRLLEQGYRVIPQYEVAHARIDLMVEGLRSRLAIECNGEYWHGPDRWEHDQARQRRLERAGLRFFTVWESAFRRDADETLEPLWHELRQMGIQPLGSGESVVLDMDGYVPTEAPQSPLESGPPEAEEPDTEPIAPPSPPESSTQAASNGHVGPTPVRPVPVAGPRVPPPIPSEESGSPSHPLPPTVLSTQAVVQQYVAWKPRPLPDPRTAPINDLIEGLKEIVAAEGPVLCLRAYQQFSRAAGVMKLHSAARGRFNQAIQRGVKAGFFELADGYGTQYQMNRFVRVKGSPLIRIRTLGPRTIHEVPPDEIGEMLRLVADRDRPATREQLFRAVLDAYGLVRATEQTLATLEEAKQRLSPPLDRL